LSGKQNSHTHAHTHTHTRTRTCTYARTHAHDIPYQLVHFQQKIRKYCRNWSNIIFKTSNCILGWL